VENSLVPCPNALPVTAGGHRQGCEKECEYKNVRMILWRAGSLFKRVTTFVSVFFGLLRVCAQSADGNAGINQATTMVNGYFAAGTSLMYAVGAILGLIGAVKVYQKWNHGDHDTGKVAAAWFGSCIFLVIVATVIKSFFGIS
jgi:hypothetical protein